MLPRVTMDYTHRSRPLERYTVGVLQVLLVDGSFRQRPPRVTQESDASLPALCHSQQQLAVSETKTLHFLLHILYDALQGVFAARARTTF